MPFTPPPLVPNFNFGVGRIALDRNDFAAHLEGVNPPYATNFRHLANQIDLVPPIVVNSDGYSTVQSALIALAANSVPPTVPQATVGATTVNLGIITLGGDVGGTALVPKVVKLQGVPVTNLAPTNGQVLAYNGTTWTPTSLASTTINISGDVTGTNIASTVVKLQGHAISASVPTTNQLFQYVGGAWAPTSNIILPGTLELTTTHTFTADVGSTVAINGSVTNGATSTITSVSGSTTTYNQGANLIVLGQLSINTNGNIAVNGATAAMYFNTGSGLSFTGTSHATWQTGTSATFNSGATLTISGELQVSNFGVINLTGTNASMFFNTGSVLAFTSGGGGGSIANWQTGTSALFDQGSTLTLNGELQVSNFGVINLTGANASMFFNTGAALAFTSGGGGGSIANWQTGTSALFDSGSTITLNGEMQVSNFGIINLTGSSTMFVNTGTALILTTGGIADWETGSTAIFDVGSTMNINTPIQASTGSNVGFGSLTVPLTTLNGATTLTSSQYNRPNLNITASGSFTGTCTLVFPAVANGIWFVNTTALTTDIGSNTFRVQISGGATVNLYNAGTPVKSFSPIYIVIISNFNIYIT